ncbi:intraflagellar transport-associated protein isoform X2 [Scyliorhinus canicula]|uniref:intraflagellar transport-associated protein isoform X2 n=1 Tax=Scyliorhinus canicula TaxID=7830 RepID=UPI0018F6A060|nr:intraflagellar transport-associated protein isoform X2 [Scyliorhinus canicula]
MLTNQGCSGEMLTTAEESLSTGVKDAEDRLTVFDCANAPGGNPHTHEDLKKQKALPPEHGTKTEDDECKLVQREWSEYSVQKEGTPSKDNQEVDNYLDFGEMDSEIVTANLSNAGCEILPGEIKEENATDYSHYEYKHTSLNFKMNLKVEECNNKTLDQVLTDEVQPFTLDEDFDYDCVRLKPKYTEAELKTISALSKQKTDSGEFNAEKLKDIADS